MVQEEGLSPSLSGSAPSHPTYRSYTTLTNYQDALINFTYFCNLVNLIGLL